MPVALSLGSCPGDVHVLCGSSEWDRVCSSVYTSLIISSTAPAGGSICGGEESISIGRLILIIHDVYLLLIMLNRWLLEVEVSLFGARQAVNANVVGLPISSILLSVDTSIYVFLWMNDFLKSGSARRLLAWWVTVGGVRCLCHRFATFCEVSNRNLREVSGRKLILSRLHIASSTLLGVIENWLGFAYASLRGSWVL